MAKPVSFEHNLQALEMIVNQLEKGDLALDESLKQFEKGIIIAQKCQEQLQQAEQRITFLTQRGAEPQSGADV